ncbi:hypothetical protein [Nocardiopsis sp. CC223A]|uniref:hypothetical protein n=1 Tax=Nocardiopsis sp. CC223A TaxID=3044051 RepID=UPI00278BDF7E|nr:hypothetical protein [Nocardiopsis sp. CC223A]
MNDEYPEQALLRTLDPAPQEVSDAARARNYRRVVEEVARSRTRARLTVPLPRLKIAIAAACAVAAGVLVLPQYVPDARLPGVSTEQVTVITVGSVTDIGVLIIANVTVGDTQFLLGRMGDDHRFSVSFNGSDPDDNWERFEGSVPAPDDGLLLAGAGNFPDAAKDGLAYAYGPVGADVAAVSVITQSGEKVPATISNGWFLAAWEGRDFYDAETLGSRFTLTLRDGTTRTVDYLDTPSVLDH